jgi:hypothetical protein
VSEKIVVPISFRAGEQEISRERIIWRIAAIQTKKMRADEEFEKFKSKYLLR